MRCALFVVLVLLGFTWPARAQVTVSLITFGPGPEAFEKFGHTALRVRAPGFDAAYNWGMFDFENRAELFTGFVRGRLRYWMQPSDGQWMIDAYGGNSRSVWEQDLNLTADQTRALLDYLAWNERDENKVYKYDYYRDNCTTRVRDAIDNATGGPIAKTLKGVPTGTTYRSHTRALVAGDVTLYTGMQAALAAWVDQPLDAWQESFLPMELQRHIRSVKTVDDAGNVVPLVRSERTLYAGTYPILGATPPTYWPWYLLSGSLVGGAMALLAGPARTKAWAAGALFLPILAWSLVGGIGGAIMWFAWLFTDHVVGYRNENMLQTNVLLFAMIPLAFVSLVFKRGRTGAFRFAAWIAYLSVLGLVIKVLPWFRQNNVDTLALAVPLNVGLALAMWRLNLRSATFSGRPEGARLPATPDPQVPLRGDR